MVMVWVILKDPLVDLKNRLVVADIGLVMKTVVVLRPAGDLSQVDLMVSLRVGSVLYTRMEPVLGVFEVGIVMVHQNSAIIWGCS